MSDIWGGVANAGTGIISSIIGGGQSRRNRELQEKTLEWQKEQQAINNANVEWEKEQYMNMLQREDSAVQRRAADLKAAGINPVLAAGQAATTGSVSSPNMVEAASKTPQYDYADQIQLPDISAMIQIAQQIEDLRGSREENQNAKFWNELEQWLNSDDEIVDWEATDKNFNPDDPSTWGLVYESRGIRNAMKDANYHGFLGEKAQALEAITSQLTTDRDYRRDEQSPSEDLRRALGATRDGGKLDTLITILEYFMGSQGMGRDLLRAGANAAIPRTYRRR